jgi:hypothetical protein
VWCVTRGAAQRSFLTIEAGAAFDIVVTSRPLRAVNEVV